MIIKELRISEDVSW